MMLRVVLVALVAIIVASEAAKYTVKYDNIDLDEILSNDRLLNNYFDCLMKEGKEAKCSPDGAELKKHLAEALKNGCGECSDKQKEGAKKVINFLIENKPEMWKKLEEKYDPTGEYRKRYQEKIN